MRKLLLLICAFAVLLTGCSARAGELEESAIIKVLAVDRGERGKYLLTAYIAGAKEASMVSAEADSVAEAFFQLNTRASRRIYLGQLRVVLLSSDIRDIEEPALYLYCSDDVRSTAKVLTVNGAAKDVLEYRGLYNETAADIEQTIKNAAENANLQEVTLYSCVNSMAAENGCCILPAAKLKEEELSIEKSAVYRKYRILQTLTAEEQTGSAFFCGKENVFFTIDRTGFAVSGVSVKCTAQKESNLIRVKGTYKVIADAFERPTDREEEAKQELERVMRAVWDVAAKLNVQFPGMEDCDMSLPAEFEIELKPAYNDYPMKGVYAE